MKLHCPDCGSPIPAAHVDLRTGLAKCGQCDSVFSFTPEPGGRRPPAPPQTPVPRPPRMVVEDFAGTWSARWRWFSPVHLFLAVFCVAWDSFLVAWYSIALSQHGAPFPFNWLMVVFPIAHVAVGISLTYVVLTGFLNRTVVRVAGRTVSVTHGPLPWRQPPPVDGGRIDHLTTAWDLTGRRPATALLTTLSAVMTDGASQRLVTGLRGAGEADWLRQQLEQRLNLGPGPATPAPPMMSVGTVE